MTTSPRFFLMLLCGSALSCGGDDGKPVEASDAAAPSTPVDAALGDTQDDDAAPPDPQTLDDGGVLYAQLADGSDAVDEVIPKSACELLSISEVSAVLGEGLLVMGGSGGEQCHFGSANPEHGDVGALLEEVTNGKAIYAATLDAYASSGVGATPVSGFGDQATFTSSTMDHSSMQVVVGDLVLRLSLGWGEPGVDTDTQLAGEKQLLQLALGRL